MKAWTWISALNWIKRGISWLVHVNDRRQLGWYTLYVAIKWKRKELFPKSWLYGSDSGSHYGFTEKSMKTDPCLAGPTSNFSDFILINSQSTSVIPKTVHKWRSQNCGITAQNKRLWRITDASKNRSKFKALSKPRQRLMLVHQKFSRSWSTISWQKLWKLEERHI